MNLDDILISVLVTENANTIINLNEEAKTNAADKVSTALFKSIKDKAIKCDFSIANATKGNIKKLSCYNDVMNALKCLTKICSSNKANSDLKECVDIIKEALNNITSCAPLFEKGFSSGNKMMQYVYNSFATSIVTATAYIAAKGVAVVSVNAYNTMASKENVKLSENANIRALVSLNKMAKGNGLKKSLENMLDLSGNLQEATMLDNNRKDFYGLDSIHEGVATDVFKVIGAGIKIFEKARGLGKVGLIIASILVLLWAARRAVYAYYLTRVKLSEYLAQLSEFIKMNASTQSNEKIKAKQEKYADKLEKLSRKIELDQDVASQRVNEELADEDKEISTSYSNDGNNQTDIGVF